MMRGSSYEILQASHNPGEVVGEISDGRRRRSCLRNLSSGSMSCHQTFSWPKFKKSKQQRCSSTPSNGCRKNISTTSYLRRTQHFVFFHPQKLRHIYFLQPNLFLKTLVIGSCLLSLFDQELYHTRSCRTHVYYCFYEQDAVSKFTVNSLGTLQKRALLIIQSSPTVFHLSHTCIVGQSVLSLFYW